MSSLLGTLGIKMCKNVTFHFFQLSNNICDKLSPSYRLSILRRFLWCMNFQHHYKHEIFKKMWFCVFVLVTLWEISNERVHIWKNEPSRLIVLLLLYLSWYIKIYSNNIPKVNEIFDDKYYTIVKSYCKTQLNISRSLSPMIIIYHQYIIDNMKCFANQMMMVYSVTSAVWC